MGYLCIDYDGEPDYSRLNVEWQNAGKYVVVHRMAFTENARGKGVSDTLLGLVEEKSRQKGIYSFRVDTDADNKNAAYFNEKRIYIPGNHLV